VGIESTDRVICNLPGLVKKENKNPPGGAYKLTRHCRTALIRPISIGSQCTVPENLFEVGDLSNASNSVRIASRDPTKVTRGKRSSNKSRTGRIVPASGKLGGRRSLEITLSPAEELGSVERS